MLERGLPRALQSPLLQTVLDGSFSLTRWKNWWVRGILTLAMIAFFFIIIYLGPMVLMMIVSTIDMLAVLVLHSAFPGHWHLQSAADSTW